MLEDQEEEGQEEDPGPGPEWLAVGSIPHSTRWMMETPPRLMMARSSSHFASKRHPVSWT